MKECNSSQVRRHGHCAATNTLSVEFASGGTYHYHGVNPQQYEELCKAESVGKHLHANVKGKFEFTKHEEKK
jgi:hypothetical protein